MSLINKMLQDLDARGAQPGAAPPDNVWHGPRREPRMVWRAIALGMLAVVVLGLLVVFALPFLRHPAAPVGVPTVAPIKAAKPNVVEFAAAPVNTPAALAPATAAPGATSVAAVPVAVANTPLPASGAPVPAAGTPAPAAPVAPTASVAPDAAAPLAVAGDKATPAAPHRQAMADADASGKSAPSKPMRSARNTTSDAALATPANGVSAAGGTSLTGREMTPVQRAENEYRRALDSLQEGRVAEAVASLQQALVIAPRHQAARETLIRLLLENNRQEEATRQMELGLGLDANQPALAMVLARLQVEKGGPAIETLTRTLPFAASNGEYQAFLAALLQRAQRNQEAAEHYRLALRGAPQNGVWWMGLGISLQADQHLPEARDAFERAKATGALTPELQIFVERRLQQLAH